MSKLIPTRLKVMTPPVSRTELPAGAPQAASDVPQTPYLNLNLPPTGFPSWGPDLNQNFSAIDAAVGALQRSYQGEWINNRVYAAGQIVIFEGGVFISLASGNIGLQPNQHPDSWGAMGSASSITYPPPGIAVSTGSGGWAPSINPATIPSFPNAGIPVSTSTAWAASIPTADVARLSAPISAFKGILRSMANMEVGGVDTVLEGLTIAWNLRSGYGETAFINNPGSGTGGFSWYNAASFTHVDGTTYPAMILDSSSTLNVTGNVTAAGLNSLLQAGGNTGETTAGLATARLVLVVNGQTGVAYPGQWIFDTRSSTTTSSMNDSLSIRHFSSGPDGASPELFSFNGAGNASFNGGVSCDHVNTSGTGVDIAGFRLWTDGGSSFIDGRPSGRLLLNQQMGEGSVVIITGSCSATQGFFTSGAKAFRIPHPLDEEKMLTHASLEGPELGIYYRGEAETVEGRVEVTLPDYFEALTLQEKRTVQLTQLYEEEDDALALLAASRVKEGKFRVRSSNPSQKFYWEVKAVRGDIGELIIEDTKENKDVSATRKKQPAAA